jgi:hypothetical protein
MISDPQGEGTTVLRNVGYSPVDTMWQYRRLEFSAANVGAELDVFTKVFLLSDFILADIRLLVDNKNGVLSGIN